MLCLYIGGALIMIGNDVIKPASPEKVCEEIGML